MEVVFVELYQYHSEHEKGGGVPKLYLLEPMGVCSNTANHLCIDLLFIFYKKLCSGLVFNFVGFSAKSDLKIS